MDVSKLLNNYFISVKGDVSINVFDASTINAVYQRVISMLTNQLKIEVSFLQGFSYCFYEILDNVLTHSGKEIGTVITYYDSINDSLRILVADDGIGVMASLSADDRYANITETEALLECIRDTVTDGKGMGFGLYATSRLAKSVGLRFEIASGSHKLVYENGCYNVVDIKEWSGTIVYLDLHTNKELDPNEVVAYRTDCVSEYNDMFIDDSNLNNLW